MCRLQQADGIFLTQRLAYANYIRRIKKLSKTIRNADKIVVIDGGHINSGTHEELLRNSERYSRFIKLREEAANWKMHTA